MTYKTWHCIGSLRSLVWRPKLQAHRLGFLHKHMLIDPCCFKIITNIYTTAEYTWIFLFLDLLNSQMIWQSSAHILVFLQMTGVSCAFGWCKCSYMHRFRQTSHVCIHVAIWVCDHPCSIVIKIDFYYWWTHTASHTYTLSKWSK